MATKVTKMLRQSPGGHLFIWAAHLAGRLDMEEVLVEEETEAEVPVVKLEKSEPKARKKKEGVAVDDDAPPVIPQE